LFAEIPSQSLAVKYSMLTKLGRIIVLIGCVVGCAPAQPPMNFFPLDSADGLKPSNAKLDVVEFRGRKAIHMVEAPGATGHELTLVPAKFHNGTIEIEVAGQPAPGADGAARGFIGVAFRVAADASHFECFYIRPTNGRADDQLRRNHSLQYESEPDYPWFRLRKENPGVYESYADIEASVWTKLKIVVAGRKAQLYVNGAGQPSLIVNDLKLGDAEGALALWIGVGTDGYFSNLKVAEMRQ
jgi:hypothetical protein